MSFSSFKMSIIYRIIKEKVIILHHKSDCLAVLGILEKLTD